MSEMAPLEAPLGIRAVKARFCEFVEWLNERVTMSEILCFSTRAGFCGFADLAALLSSINRLYHPESKQLAHMLSLVVVSAVHSSICSLIASYNHIFTFRYGTLGMSHLYQKPRHRILPCGGP